MRDLFPGYYRPSEEDTKILWREALFVFDTNVLLNLYSYPEDAREVFLSVLDGIAERVWIPYQVALEFHKNRFGRIKGSNKAVLALKDKVVASSQQIEDEFKKIEFEKRKTGITDINDRIAAVRAANEKLVEALEAVCGRLPGTSLEDPIGARISEIFGGKVGSPPLDQRELDELVKDGEERTKRKIPPGFKDANKGEEYYDRGLTYQSKFGDLLVWRQTIKYVEDLKKSDIIFVTGDRKEDWWDIEDGRIRGPLPDLVREFLSHTKAKRFWMYTVDSFLQFSKDYLETKQVTAEAIEQVKQASDNATVSSGGFDEIIDIVVSSTSKRPVWTDTDEDRLPWVSSFSLKGKDKQHRFLAIERWLQRSYPGRIVKKSPYPDFSVSLEQGRHGFEVLSQSKFSPEVVPQRINHAQRLIQGGILLKYSLIIIVDAESRRAMELFLQEVTAQLPKLINDKAGFEIIFGILVGDMFEPIKILNR